MAEPVRYHIHLIPGTNPGVKLTPTESTMNTYISYDDYLRCKLQWAKEMLRLLESANTLAVRYKEKDHG